VVILERQPENNDPFKGPFRSLEDVADRISETLGCPITIEDSNHCILAYSTHDDNVDPARIATIMRRKVPDNVIKSLWKKGVIPQLFDSDNPVIIPAIEEVGLGKRVAISVWKNKEIIGFIWAQMNWDITNEELVLFKKAGKVVKNQMLQLQVKKRKAEDGDKDFFWQLLTGHLSDRAKIELLGEKYQFHFDGYLGIVIFQFEGDIQQSLERHVNYYVQASQNIKLICSTVDENQLILLVRPHDEIKHVQKQITDFVRAFVEEISNRLGVDTLKGGAGTLYHSPVHIKDSYREALYVLSIKDRFQQETTGIYNYQELGVFQFIDHLYEKRMQDHYQNYYIEKLKEYDLKHQTQLLDTIEVYLRFDCNINDASKALHVHVNTLNYRLKRISELTELNLKDPNQKMNLFLDLKLEQMKK
jgi:DNA-binding PucR family transcriptional regulator